jgi:RNase adapter protein RapZ
VSGRRSVAGKAQTVTPGFIVITGLSGAGKSQAIRALEDLGFFCVDNLPTALIPTFAELTLRAGSELPRAAVVVDVRERAFLERFPGVYRKLRRMKGLRPVLIFLEATDAALVRRFSETRRPHPLAPQKPVIEAIRQERKTLAAIRRMADEIIDTSDLTVHELRQAFMASGRGTETPRGPLVTIVSFGFKHGVPLDADLVFDVRFLPNPHFVPSLRHHTGRDRPVVKFLEKHPQTGEFVERVTSLLRFLLPHYAREGKSYLTIGIGCTGGKHRSVALAEALKKSLSGIEGIRLRVRHRDIASE